MADHNFTVTIRGFDKKAKEVQLVSADMNGTASLSLVDEPNMDKDINLKASVEIVSVDMWEYWQSPLKLFYGLLEAFS